jgi:hypothetical protein
MLGDDSRVGSGRERTMELKDIRDLIPFLNYLKQHRIHFQVEHSSAATVSVILLLLGQRTDIHFHDDRVDYSVFSGKNAGKKEALTDQTALFAMIEQQRRSRAGVQTAKRPPLRNANDLLAFLDYLDAIHTKFELKRNRFDAASVIIALPGYRIEIDFLEDWVEYALFTGNEDSLEDFDALFDLLEAD